MGLCFIPKLSDVLHTPHSHKLTRGTLALPQAPYRKYNFPELRKSIRGNHVGSWFIRFALLSSIHHKMLPVHHPGTAPRNSGVCADGKVHQVHPPFTTASLLRTTGYSALSQLLGQSRRTSAPHSS